MKTANKVFLLISVLLIGIIMIRFNPMTPSGALRIACVKEGHFISAFIMKTKNIEDLGWDTNLYSMNSNQCIYKITSGIPWDRVTGTNLILWIITKHKFWYSAEYYGNG